MSHFHRRLNELLDNIPESWHGTTYPNDHRFVGRSNFVDELVKLLFGDGAIRTEQLGSIFPEDYLRVGSPLSALLELVRAIEKGFQHSNVFCYASKTLALVSVLFAAKARVYVYGKSIFTEAQETMLRESYGCDFVFCSGEPQNHGEYVVFQMTDEVRQKLNPNVDAVMDSEGLLYVVTSSKVPTEDVKDVKGKILKEGIHTIRKRLGCPPPTPDAIASLRGQPVEVDPDTTSLKAHLKQMGGCDDAKGEVLIATVGLSALAACTMAGLDLGGRNIDVLMCSTAYGGSSQQTSILSDSCGLEKHTFDIQGVTGDVFTALSTKLDAMKSGQKKAITMIQLEYPTNPDMKDCDLSRLEAIIKAFQTETGSKVILVLDTTFSPISKSAADFKDIPVIVFNSLSKSVSGGFTTGGSLVANHHPLAQQLLETAHAHLALFDTYSKGCQLRVLCERHTETEVRVAEAHKNCIVAAAHLEKVVEAHSGQVMKVNFVTPVQMAKAVTPATFSFNLPAPSHLAKDSNALEALAQSFVDQLVAQYPHGIKPCVSFGQKNTLVYATVPATSTQGVISEEDKSKQAIGGVQLARFSFPPQMDMAAFNQAMTSVVKATYTLKASL